MPLSAKDAKIRVPARTRTNARRPGTEPAAQQIETIYDETIALLEDARAYTEELLASNTRSRGNLPTIRSAHGISRVSAVLTQAMAWILVWRAVCNGEMTRHEALAPELRLTHIEAPGIAGDDMEPGLRRLLDTSLALYARVGKLERRLMDA